EVRGAAAELPQCGKRGPVQRLGGQDERVGGGLSHGITDVQRAPPPQLEQPSLSLVHGSNRAFSHHDGPDARALGRSAVPWPMDRNTALPSGSRQTGNRSLTRRGPADGIPRKPPHRRRRPRSPPRLAAVVPTLPRAAAPRASLLPNAIPPSRGEHPAPTAARPRAAPSAMERPPPDPVVPRTSPGRSRSSTRRAVPRGAGRSRWAPTIARNPG